MRAQPAGHLPAELTSFVGRREALTRVKSVLASARLVTLTGMGGIGKTRLARRLAGEIRRTFPDGVWLVELADLQEGALLPQTISATLGVRDESRDPVGTLIDHLRDRQCLLVLDNCEHLREPCALLIGKLLAAVPTLKIVATSRHVLGVEGEHVFPVSALTHDPDEDGISEAVELFEERATAADPGFRVTAANRETITAICGRLEGMPLAVELAAANVRSFSPAEILDRLQDPELLSTRECTRPSRHRTLDAAVEWSYRLCTPHERRAWEQLSVFAGGFTAESAEAVCLLAPGATVVGSITGLVDKSVISRVDADGRHTRYRMLEPVRQFAAERLSAGPDGPEVHRRHRDYYLRLARLSRTDYCSSRDVDWYATTRMEQPNIRQALAYSLSDADEPEVAVEMAASLRPFWQQSGSILEGYKWLRRALDRAPAPSHRRAAGLVSASILGLLLEEGDAARKLLEEHTALAAGEGYHDFAPPAHLASALEAVADGDFAVALDRAEQAVSTGLELDDPGTAAEAMALAALCVFILDHERAEELTTRFLEFAEARGAHLMKAIALYPLGAVRWRNGDTRSATALMREAIRLYQMFEHPGMVAVCIEGLAWSTPGDDPEGAAKLLGAAKSVWKYSQMRLPETAVQRVGRSIETQLRQELGDLCFEQAYAAGRELKYDEAVALALGARSQPRPKATDQSGRGGRAPREREIATLVAEGLTNREIAARLVISHRTADAHVEHILAKLGFRSRTQIARWLTLQDQAG